MLALTIATTAEAAVQTCSVALAGGAHATLHIEERGRSIAALGMDFTPPVGRSAHECSIGVRRGDRHSRWRGGATYVTITDPAARPFEAAVQRYRGELQLGISAPGGDLASCSTIAVPGTVIVTPKEWTLHRATAGTTIAGSI